MARESRGRAPRAGAVREAGRSVSTAGSVSAALVGLGRIGWSLELDALRYHPCTHAGTLRALSRGKSRFHLSVVCDRAPGRMEAFERWWPSSPQHARLQTRKAGEALAAPGLDLAVIAVSLSSHVEVFEQAIACGIRRILIEKPVAMTARAAQRLLRLARDAGAQVWVNFERRYHPFYRYARSVVSDGRLGPLRAVRGRVLTGDVRRGATFGPLLHDAVHWIDLLLWMAGRPPAASARVLGRRGAPEHTTFARFDYPQFSATLETGGRRGFFEFEMELDFAEGRIHVGNQGLRVWQAGPSARYQRFRELRPRLAPVKPKNPWVEMYREIQKAEGPPASSLADAVTGLEILEQILAAR